MNDVEFLRDEAHTADRDELPATATRLRCIANSLIQKQAILDDIDTLRPTDGEHYLTLLANDPYGVDGPPRARVAIAADWLDWPRQFEGKDLAEALRNAVLAKEAVEQAEGGENE